VTIAASFVLAPLCCDEQAALKVTSERKTRTAFGEDDSARHIAIGGCSSAFDGSTVFRYGSLLGQKEAAVPEAGRSADRHANRSLGTIPARHFGAGTGRDSAGSTKARLPCSDEPDKLALRTSVSVNVAFGRLDGPVAREKLHVAEAASGTMDVTGGDRDETASP
jgi:hypothetical protein